MEQFEIGKRRRDNLFIARGASGSRWRTRSFCSAGYRIGCGRRHHDMGQKSWRYHWRGDYKAEEYLQSSNGLHSHMWRNRGVPKAFNRNLFLPSEDLGGYGWQRHATRVGRKHREETVEGHSTKPLGRAGRRGRRGRASKGTPWTRPGEGPRGSERRPQTRRSQQTPKATTKARRDSGAEERNRARGKRQKTGGGTWSRRPRTKREKEESDPNASWRSTDRKDECGTAGDSSWRPEGSSASKRTRREEAGCESPHQWKCEFTTGKESQFGQPDERPKGRQEIKRVARKQEAEEEKEEEKEEVGLQEKAKEEEQLRRRKQPVKFQLKFREIRSRKKTQKPKFFQQQRLRLASPSEETVTQKAWGSFAVVGEPGRGAVVRDSRGRRRFRFSFRRNKDGKLLSSYVERRRATVGKSRLPRTLPVGKFVGPASAGTSRSARRRVSVKIPSNTTGSPRWRMGCCEASGNFYSGTCHSSWKHNDVGGSQTCSTDGKSEGPGELQGQGPLLCYSEGRQRLQLAVPIVGQLRRIRKRKRQKRQGQKQGRLWRRKRKSLVAWRIRLGGRAQRRRKGEGNREGQSRRKVGLRGIEAGGFFHEVRSMKQMGVALWLCFLKCRGSDIWSSLLGTDFDARRCLKKICQGVRVPRKRRELFPLPSLWNDLLVEFPLEMSFEKIIQSEEIICRFSLACWDELSVVFLNYLFSKQMGVSDGKCTAMQQDLLKSVEKSISRLLTDDVDFGWDGFDIEEDFKKRTLSYEGEEIAKAEELCVSRVEPALPPKEHGGSIELSDWIEGRTRVLLENPEMCLQADVGQELPRLQARVHIKAGEERQLAELLVQRRICTWVDEDEVLVYRNQRVLNGLFGVEKSTLTPSGETSLRCIMNLIPSNSILRQLEGHVHQLPHVSQWLNVCLGEEEELRLYQSDMVSAFYLFRLPQRWARMLAFGLHFDSHQLGINLDRPSRRLYLACQVLPMGWSSAVGLMQEVAQQVLWKGGLDRERQIRKDAVLPAWLTDCVREAETRSRAWWHVYLDNYAGGEKCRSQDSQTGLENQQLTKKLWEAAGIISSQKKDVVGAAQVVELGAFVGGEGRWIGGSPERMLKTIKATLYSLVHRQMSRKRLQILLGRWVFILQFRRPGMSCFEDAWKIIGEKRCPRKTWRAMRLELLLACFAGPLFHTWLGAKVEEVTTCSDASNRGGAIAVSRELSSEGQQFLEHLKPKYRPLKVPVLLISLFHGIGGSSRCYDIAGVELRGSITADIHKPANRVCSRRWANGEMFEDVRKLDRATLEALVMKFGDVEEIHLWAGFPCVDLSSAKAGRLNLSGQHSSLIYEVVRILKDLRELFPEKRIHFVIENVASMDISARDSISELLETIPYKVDPIHQAPLPRPRFCWTSLELFAVEGITLEDKVGYVEVTVAGSWPEASQWLDEDSSQIETDVIYPTCMKAIARDQPPWKPAGLDRTDSWAQARWQEDSYRHPPYQYKQQYLIYDKSVSRCRLLNANEREVLMGYGVGHTLQAYSASKAKQNSTAFEDERCSLIGDSFSIFSFMIFASFAVYPWVGRIEIEKMNKRVGLPPGYRLNLDYEWPMSTHTDQPLPHTRSFTAGDLNAFLLRRTNHTGSDVRITTGALMNPRRYPRQSVSPTWWRWQQIFATRWKYSEHINSLEIRAIYLTLLWKLRQRKFVCRRMFHVTDSYVAMSILSKGRTSSKALQPLVRKLCALLLAAQTQLILAHVDSSENPTDEGSRS